MPFLIKYPVKKNFLYWSEIQLLSDIIHFPIHILKGNLASSGNTCSGGKNSNCNAIFAEGIPLHYLRQVLFNEDFLSQVSSDVSTIAAGTMEPAGLINLFETCSRLLLERRITFDQIRASKRAYQFYEDHTHSIPTNESVLQKAMQLAGRVCCPLLSSNLLKPYKRKCRKSIDILDFIVIAVECTSSEELNVEDEELGVMQKDDRGLFVLCDFDTLFVPMEERKKQKLESKLKSEQLEAKMKRLKELDEAAIAEAINRRKILENHNKISHRNESNNTGKDNSNNNARAKSAGPYRKFNVLQSAKLDLEVCRERYHMMLRDIEEERKKNVSKLRRESSSSATLARQRPTSAPANSRKKNQEGSKKKSHFPRPGSAPNTNGKSNNSSNSPVEFEGLFNEDSGSRWELRRDESYSAMYQSNGSLYNSDAKFLHDLDMTPSCSKGKLTRDGSLNHISSMEKLLDSASPPVAINHSLNTSLESLRKLEDSSATGGGGGAYSNYVSSRRPSTAGVIRRESVVFEKDVVMMEAIAEQDKIKRPSTATTRKRTKARLRPKSASQKMAPKSLSRPRSACSVVVNRDNNCSLEERYVDLMGSLSTLSMTPPSPFTHTPMLAACKTQRDILT
eukprot:Nk52_evm74s158 gene=Nk52_evmTU74s158